MTRGVAPQEASCVWRCACQKASERLLHLDYAVKVLRKRAAKLCKAKSSRVTRPLIHCRVLQQDFLQHTGPPLSLAQLAPASRVAAPQRIDNLFRSCRHTFEHFQHSDASVHHLLSGKAQPID
ncbi:unnamed protein product [Symbiodinium sp. CCMP2592]|nr:unnamed protein product [Symbiodinium sp. CCMP2592]